MIKSKKDKKVKKLSYKVKIILGIILFLSNELLFAQNTTNVCQNILYSSSILEKDTQERGVLDKILDSDLSNDFVELCKHSDPHYFYSDTGMLDYVIKEIQIKTSQEQWSKPRFIRHLFCGTGYTDETFELHELFFENENIARKLYLSLEKMNKEFYGQHIYTTGISYYDWCLNGKSILFLHYSATQLFSDKYIYVLINDIKKLIHIPPVKSRCK